MMTMALATLGACLLLFFGGYFMGRSGLSAARSELARNKTESATMAEQARSETQQVQSQLSTSQARERVSSARGWLYRTVMEVDRRNFGTAQSNLTKAKEVLDSGALEAAGFATQSQSVKDAVGEVSVSVASDTAVQREQILKAASQLDEMLDAAPSGEPQ
jgi:hypothetical protein